MNWIGVLLGVWLLLSSPLVNAETTQKPLREPPIQIINWNLHWSLGIVVQVEDGTYYSFPILAQYPVKECKEVRKVGKEFYLMSDGIRYVVSSIPMLYLKPPNDWVMYGKDVKNRAD